MQLQQVALMDSAVIDAEAVVIRPTFVRHIRAPTDERLRTFRKSHRAPPATASAGSPAPAIGPGTAVIPANATSVSPTQAMGKPSNTAAAFLFENEVYMQKPP